MSGVRLQRKVGLAGAVFLMVGNVVGASIFILPGNLAGIAGPAVFIAYLIAIIPAFFNTLVAAQVGGILPVSASDYVFTSIVLHPLLGFLKVWAAMLGALVGGPILAYGFADYFAFFMPDLSRLTIAVAIVVIIMMINLLGIRSSVKMQMVMVSIFVIALLILSLGGLFFIDLDLLTPMAPLGWGAVLSAAVPAYFSYTGFTMLLSITEEIKNPAKNIPLITLYTFLIVAFIYISVTFVVPGLIPWQELGAIAAPLSAAAATFLPEWYSTAITLAALLAAGTSINMIIITCSRSFFAVARNRIYPDIFNRVSRRTGEPDTTIILVAFVILGGIAFQGNIAQYASVSVIGWMLYGIIWGVALVLLPKKLPDHYNNAQFKLSPTWLWITAVVNIVIGALFIFIAVRDNTAPALGYFFLLFLGVVYYLLRQRVLAKEGISLEALLRNETEEATRATQEAIA
ncbi:MAG: amino acid permease [Gammaproteobacteria bacterium]|nr:amino acid permease [Gammaproteobacteria bacterium]MDD9958282.1 amino acid permease [Gammaproteobacteria bacterium]